MFYSGFVLKFAAFLLQLILMENCRLHFDNSNAHLPPGFRFHPTDEELTTHYLLKKVLNSSFSSRAIAVVDFNKCEPWELPAKATMGEKEWYFFSLRDRKYPSGLRTNRATEGGYWKATGKDREIYSSRTGFLVGMKKTLVFYMGRAPRGEKSNWVMHEYRLEGKLAYHFLSVSSKDEWVVFRVFQKTSGLKRASTVGDDPFYDVTTSGTMCDGDVFYKRTKKDHVPCLSTFASSKLDGSQFQATVCVPSLPGRSSVAVSGSSPSILDLHSIQENLPLFFSALRAPAPAQVRTEAMNALGGTDLTGCGAFETEIWKGLNYH